MSLFKNYLANDFKYDENIIYSDIEGMQIVHKLYILSIWSCAQAVISSYG